MRPTVFDYTEIPAYLQAMLSWHKAVDPHFSIRREAHGEHRCSPALVTRVLQGQRKLTPERVGSFARIFRLSSEEKSYLERWVKMAEAPGVRRVGATRAVEPAPASGDAKRPPRRRKTGQNHLLADWLNVYVKDASRLRGFQPDPRIIHRLLGGIASDARIERSLRFLLREGFLRRTLDGRVVEADSVVATSDELPDAKIRAFHLQALEVAKRGIKTHPVERRRASALVMALDHRSFLELKEIIGEFQERLTTFMEDHASDSEQLYQVLINLCPVGGFSDEAAP